VAGPADQCQLADLFHQAARISDGSWPSFTVRISGEAIEITLALRIPHPDAFAARQNHTERLVVVGAEARFRRDESGTGGSSPSSASSTDQIRTSSRLDPSKRAVSTSSGEGFVRLKVATV
jgi:hypothetical protein